MTTDNENLKTIYSGLGLLDCNGKGLTLHSDCPNCAYCWKDIADRKPENDGFWTVTQPWIGERFSELGLLVIGVNMNEFGGYDGATELIKKAKDEIAKGKKKMFVSDTYSGTFLFHRMGSYATALAERENIFTPTWIDDFPAASNIASAFDYLSYTNQIKCSPRMKKSKPTYQIWERCGNFILKLEIELLKPKRLLVLGVSDNFLYLNRKVLDTEITLNWKGEIGFGSGCVNNKAIEIFVVPHPASFGGNSCQIMKDIRALMLGKK
jgi:hypothetical protein